MTTSVAMTAQYASGIPTSRASNTESVAAAAVRTACHTDGRFSFFQLQSFITQSSRGTGPYWQAPACGTGGIHPRLGSLDLIRYLSLQNVRARCPRSTEQPGRWLRYGYSWIKPRRVAVATASVRLTTSSLLKMLLTCVFTVPSLMNNSAPISLLLLPAAMR